MKKWEQKLNKQEIELYETKWFDYRVMSPDVATMKFMLAYGQSMRQYNHLIGLNRYFFVMRQFPSVKLSDLRKNRQFKILAGLRRWVDKHGMPYPTFWSYANDAHLNMKFVKNFISAYCNKKLLAVVNEMWTQRRQEVIVRSEFDYFRAENFAGLEAQCDYYDYLIGETQRRYSREESATKLDDLVESGELDQKYLQACAARKATRKAA